MKKLLIILTVFLQLGFAKSSLMSALPLPSNDFVNLGEEDCGIDCMEELMQNEEYFSFMANYSKNLNNENINKNFESLDSLFKGLTSVEPRAILEEVAPEKLENTYAKIAILIPQKKIHRYSTTVVNSTIAYLLARDSSFDIKVFNTQDESSFNLSFALENIRKQGFKVVIAPVTPAGANYITSNVADLLVFIPTINKKSNSDARENIIFGGIDYEKQIEKLSTYVNDNVATFSDGSLLGVSLDDMVDTNFDVKYHNKIINSKVSLKSMLKDNETLQNSSVFLNMPLVKSSLLASQLRVYDIVPHALLSTQINYHPMLLTLTQLEDRKELYIANSIQKSPLNIRATNALFEHSIVYDWVNYSTNVGLDYIFCKYFAKDSERSFEQSVQSGQIVYENTIMRSLGHSFVEASE